MEYKTIVAFGDNPNSAQEDLDNQVNYAICDGWKLQGGVSITVLDIGYTFRIYLAQAMVKND